jgi:hypothetical protein
MLKFRLLALASLASLVLLFGPGKGARGDELPATAKKLLDDHDKETKEIKRKAEEDLQKSRKKLLDGLQALEASFTKEAKLAQAQAVRQLLKDLKVGPVKAQADPGTLTAFRGQQGKSFYFEVTGGNVGSVWGTDIYTDDSTLAAAAVHAGVLQVGQKGIVKVTVLPGEMSYLGTTRNGITTANWPAWQGSYKVEAVRR